MRTLARLAIACTSLVAAYQLYAQAPTRIASEPRWITTLRSSPIHPGKGMAGIEIGQSMQRVRNRLNQPDKEQVVRSMKGEFVSTVWNYMWLGRTLTLSFSSQNILTSIRVSDEQFNADRRLSIGGTNLSLGASVFDLMKYAGRPRDIDGHLTCPSSIADGMAYTWSYDGISYWICGNNKIYLIDVPR